MNEEALDLDRFRRAIARGKWILVAFVTAGLIMAALFSAARLPGYTASTVVLLPPAAPDASGQSTRDISTEAHVATSDVVLSLASKALHGHPSVDELRREVKVSSPTPNILVFKGRDKSARDAIAVSNAAAGAYRSYSATSASNEAAQVTSPLNRRIGELQASIALLQSQIDGANRQLASLSPNSADQPRLSAQVAQWSLQQQDAVQELQTDRARATEAKTNSDANQAIKVISPATTASNGAVKTVGFNLVFGALFGLLLGIAVVIARDSRDRALRLRSEIAAAAGVPTVASIQAGNARKSAEWLALLEHYQPNADEQWSLRKLLRTIQAADASPPANVVVVSLASDDTALAVAPQLACFAADSGLRTVLIVNARTAALLPMQQVRDVAAQAAPVWPRRPRQAVSGVRLRENLSIVEEMPAEAIEGAPPVDLTVRMIVADRSGLDSEELKGATTLLSVSPGAATPDQVAAVAAAAAEANAPLTGIVVANPEPGDTSDGIAAARRHHRMPPATGSAS